MSNKNAESPRRVYARKGITHVCFDGKLYGAKRTAIDTDHAVRCEVLESDGGRARIQVLQNVPGGSPIVEVWRSVSV